MNDCLCGISFLLLSIPSYTCSMYEIHQHYLLYANILHAGVEWANAINYYEFEEEGCWMQCNASSSIACCTACIATLSNSFIYSCLPCDQEKNIYELGFCVTHWVCVCMCCVVQHAAQASCWNAPITFRMRKSTASSRLKRYIQQQHLQHTAHLHQSYYYCVW